MSTSKYVKVRNSLIAAAIALAGTAFAATENVDGIDWTYDVVNGAARIYAGNKVAIRSRRRPAPSQCRMLPI